MLYLVPQYLHLPRLNRYENIGNRSKADKNLLQFVHEDLLLIQLISLGSLYIKAVAKLPKIMPNTLAMRQIKNLSCNNISIK